MVTSHGRTFLLLAVVLLLLGLVTGYTELLIIGAACALVGLVAFVWLLFRPQLMAERDIRPNRVVEGTLAQAVLTVSNRSRRRSPPMVVLEHFGEAVVPVTVPSLGRGASHTRPYSLPTERRGVFQVGPMTVSRSDPFQVVQAGQAQRSTETLWVHPATHDVAPFPNGRNRDLEGPTSGEAPQGGIAFHTLRPYVVGDDLRLIHWKSSARTGDLMVRHNVDTFQPRSLILLDVNAAVHTEDGFEQAVRVVASLLTASIRNNFPVRLRTTAGLVLGSETGSRLDRVLDQLAALELVPEATLASLSRRVGSERGGFSLAVVTGQASAKDLAVIGPLRSRFQNITIARLGVDGRSSVYELPGAVLINASTSTEFAQAWNRRIRR
ncbi:MAG: DUF58 domain-containing protein [Acidimicrobiia bacterium]|nr:DUF58 domain-containing protein [Acidimicrobiia bacterium]